MTVPIIALLAALSMPAFSQAPSASSASQKSTCPIVRSEPTEADRLIARHSYKEAEDAFRAALVKDPASPDAGLGLVRALIGQNKVTAAQDEAAGLIKKNPRSAVAEVAASEADYRAANVGGASQHSKLAYTYDPCEGRAAGALADLFQLNAMFGRAAALRTRAHLVRPNDEIIRRDWIASLPRKRRQEELAKYLAEKPALAADESRMYNASLEHLKARHPGECHISSKSEHVSTPLQPVYGDRTAPVAYGLDVAFDGKRRRMQIDTGASGILLTKGAARTLGLTPEFHLKAGGVGDEGDVDSYLTHVKSIRIGDVEVSDCMVEVIEKSRLDVDGLIGMDVFERWLVTLDYQEAQLRLAPLPPRPGAPAKRETLASDGQATGGDDDDDAPEDRFVSPEMKDFENILRIGHNILLPVGTTAKEDHYIIMDTGAGISNLSVDFGKQVGKLHGSNMQIKGISGEVKKVMEVENTPLFVANLQVPPSTYIVYDMTAISHNTGFETSGLFGLPTLQRLTISIDYRDNLIKLSYDPKRDKIRF